MHSNIALLLSVLVALRSFASAAAGTVPYGSEDKAGYYFQTPDAKYEIADGVPVKRVTQLPQHCL